MNLSAIEREQISQSAFAEARRRLGGGFEDWHDWPNVWEWIPENFIIYDTGDFCELYPSQVDALKEAMHRQPNGAYTYETVLWSWPKKSAKSTLIAAVCHYVAMHRNRAQIRLVANDLKQAESRVGFYMRENIKLHHRRGKLLDVNVTQYRITYPNGSVIDMVPVDPKGEAGGNDDLIVFSELWGWKHRAHQEMWAEMTISPTKAGQAQIWIDTYAGYSDGGSPILEPLYQKIVQPENRVHGTYEFYGDKAARMFATWITVPLLPWQTNDYYTTQAARLTPAQFDRMHRNQWTADEEVFVPYVWWEACQGQVGKLEREPMVLGVDAGVSNDCFAIVGVTRKADKIAVRYVKVWVPPKDKDIDFDEPEAEIVRLCKQYNVVQVAYDPYQLEHTMQRLKRQNVGWMKKFDQSSRRLLADKKLHDMIRDRQLTHGDDTTLNDHIRNANMKTSGDIDKLRIVKRNDTLKIDAAVALSMAAYEAMRLNLA